MNFKVGDQVAYTGKRSDSDPVVIKKFIRSQMRNYGAVIIATIIGIDIKQQIANVKFGDGKGFTWNLDSIILIEQPADIFLSILK